jgi:hypothetical protein
MKTTSSDARDERRVGGGTVDETTQTGLPPTGSLDTSGLESGAIGVTDAPQEVGNSVCVVDEEDGILPDDAPEMALEDIDEEV